jgi:hypothetical protein
MSGVTSARDNGRVSILPAASRSMAWIIFVGSIGSVIE